MPLSKAHICDIYVGKYGNPKNVTSIVPQLHEGMLARVEDNGERSHQPASNVVTLGYVLALTLFSSVLCTG